MVKLYTYFGLIGVTSVALWIVALALFSWACRRDRRHIILLLAFALATGGLILGRINSASVSAIRTDFSEEKAAAQKNYAAERGTAKVRFIEDSAHDQLDMAGMKREERLAVDAEVDPGMAIPDALDPATNTDDFKQKGKVTRETGKKDPLKVGGDDELSAADKAEIKVRMMKPADVLLANRLDRYNLFFTKIIFWLLLFSVIWDYFKNFNSTTATYFPLPLSSQAIDAIFPKAHSVIVEKPETGAMAHYMETVVRKGESFIYFGPADPWPDDWALPRLLLGRRPLFPFAKIAAGEVALPRTPQFFWDSAWFGRYAVLVTDTARKQNLLNHLLSYLRLRQRTQASARRTVNFVWNFGTLPDHLLKELIKLAAETNLKFIYAAPTLPARSVVKSFSEAYCDDASIAALQPEPETALADQPAAVLKQIRHPLVKYAFATLGVIAAGALGTWIVLRQMPAKIVEPVKVATTAPGPAANRSPSTTGTAAVPGQTPPVAGVQPGSSPSPAVGTETTANPQTPVTTTAPEPAAPAEDPNDPLVQAVREVRSLRDNGEFKQALDKLQLVNMNFPDNRKLDELRSIENRLKEAMRTAPQLQVALDKLSSSDETVVVAASGELMESGEIGSILMRKMVRDGNEAGATAAAAILAKQLDANAVPPLVSRLKTASPDLALQLIKALLPMANHIKGEQLKELCLLTQNDPQFKNRFVVRLLGNVIKRSFPGEAGIFNTSAGLPEAAEKLLWYADDAAKSKDKDLMRWGKETYESLRKLVLVPGLNGKYFYNETLDPVGFAFDRMDPAPNFADAGAFKLPKNRKTSFAVRWTGIIKVKTAGNYTFIVNSDDGARLWVADRSLMERGWGRKMNMEANIEFAKSGYFNFVLEYQQIDKDAAIQVTWSGPDFKMRPLAMDDLRCTPIRPPAPVTDTPAPPPTPARKPK